MYGIIVSRGRPSGLNIRRYTTMMTLKEFSNTYFPRNGFTMINSEVIDKYNEYFRDNAKVGDGATICLWTDRIAYTIIKRTPKSLTLRRCKATLKPDFKPEFIPGGFCGTVINQHEQDYDYEENENGAIVKVYWSNKYKRFRHGTCNVVAGRSEFYDYNF